MGPSLSIFPSMAGFDRRSLLLRALVFICFLNFSGLNNGYTYLTVVSPLSVRQSVSLTASVAKTFYDAAAPGNLLYGLEQGRRWANQSASWTLSLVASCLRTGTRRIVSSERGIRAPAVVGAEAGGRVSMDHRAEQILSLKQDHYVKDKKWSLMFEGSKPDGMPSHVTLAAAADVLLSDRSRCGGPVSQPSLLRFRARGSLAPSGDDADFTENVRRAVAADSGTGIGFFIFRRVRA